MGNGLGVRSAGNEAVVWSGGCYQGGCLGLDRWKSFAAIAAGDGKPTQGARSPRTFEKETAFKVAWPRALPELLGKRDNDTLRPADVG